MLRPRILEGISLSSRAPSFVWNPAEPAFELRRLYEYVFEFGAARIEHCKGKGIEAQDRCVVLLAFDHHVASVPCKNGGRKSDLTAKHPHLFRRVVPMSLRVNCESRHGLCLAVAGGLFESQSLPPTRLRRVGARRVSLGKPQVGDANSRRLGRDTSAPSRSGQYQYVSHVSIETYSPRFVPTQHNNTVHGFRLLSCCRRNL